MGLKVPTAASSVQVDFKNPKSSTKSERPFITVLGSVGVGKSTNLLTIPKREDAKHLFLSADHNTKNGLLTYLTGTLGTIEKARSWLDENATVIELTATYDPRDPRTAVDTRDYIHAVLNQSGDNGPWGGIFVEHYDYLMDDVAVNLVRYETNTPIEETPPYKQYGIRNDILGPLDAYIESAPCDVVAVSSYWDGPQEKKVPDPNDPDKKIKKLEADWPKWMKRRKLGRNSQVRFLLDKTVDEKEIGGKTVKKRQFHAEVDYSTHPHFSEGAEKDITGVGLAPFFEGDWWQKRLKEASK